MADTLLTPGDTTTTEGDDTVIDGEATVIETFNAEGVADPAGTFDKDGKEITPATDVTKVEKFDKDGKPSDTGEFDKDGNKIEKPADEGAPEKYEAFTLAEGIEISDDDLGEFQTIAKELNLSQANAQRLIDFESKRMAATAETVQKQLSDAFQKQQDEWITALKSDKEFGGENLDKNVGLAVKVINKFGSSELKTVLNDSGMGNNPDLIKMFNKIGKAISEDSLDTGGDVSSGAGKSIAEKLYPDQGKK